MYEQHLTDEQRREIDETFEELSTPQDVLKVIGDFMQDQAHLLLIKEGRIPSQEMALLAVLVGCLNHKFRERYGQS